MAAACGAVLLLALATKLLLEPVRMGQATVRAGERIRLVFSTREVPAAPAAPPPASRVDVPVPSPRASASSQRSAVAVPPPPSAPSRSTQVQLYAADGRLQLPAEIQDQWTRPPAAAPGTPRPPVASAADPLRRSTSLPVRTTRFAGDWVSDGDAADVAAQQIARARRRILEFLFGKDIQHARARPSPDVRFNPARHERAGDLGSEATGDAYKAAPIDYQPAPGLDGEASRRIREQVAALETAYARCDRARLRTLMQPLLLHLDELQKAEAALARGADPVRAAHMLPNVANNAYDMSRRALWYADARMSGCVAR